MTIYTKDSFVDTNGTALESHTPSGTGATGSWTRIDGVAGACTIQSNRVSISNTSSETAYRGTDNTTPDHYVQVEVGANGGGPYFVAAVRLTNSSNFIGYRNNFSGHELYKKVSGAFTLIGSASGSLSAGDTVYLEASGNSITVKLNGSPIIGPITESALNTVATSGIVSRNSTSSDFLRAYESGSLVSYTFARPTSDITTQWTTSTGIDHYALIDETTANDADYIYATAAGQTDELRLASMSAPQAGTDLLINYRVQGIVGSASVTLSLVCNTTVIATDTTRTFNGDYTLNVPSATWSPAVTDWTNMRLRFVSA